MKVPLEFGSSPRRGTSNGERPPLRVLVAEHAGGKLARLIGDLPATMPIEFEVEDNLAVVAMLGAQNVFDIVIIGESLMGHEVDPEIVRSLADAAHTTPILVVGQVAAGGDEEVQTGELRIVCPRRLTATGLLQEIRETLEMHVTTHLSREQQRRVECLGAIFDHLLERMPHAVAVTDESGDVCSLNRAASAFWHLPPGQIVGSHLIDSPESAGARILCLGPQKQPVEVVPEPIQWLGHRYFLTSLRRVEPGMPGAAPVSH